jgi:hypothetical protein
LRCLDKKEFSYAAGITAYSFEKAEYYQYEKGVEETL